MTWSKPAGGGGRSLLGLARKVIGPSRVHQIGKSWRKQRLRFGARIIDFRGVRLELDPTSANSESVLSGRFERPLMDFVLARVVPGDFCLDVGAHVGYWAVPLAAAVGPEGRVIAVEAHAPNVQRLRANIALNSLGNVDVRHAAATESSGTAQLQISGTSSSWNSIVASGTYFGDQVTLVEVPAVALDDLDVPVDIAVLKIDVEGAEASVLAGAEKVLESTRMLVLEIGGVRVTSREYAVGISTLLFGHFDRVLAVDKPTGVLVPVISLEDLLHDWIERFDVTKVVAYQASGADG